MGINNFGVATDPGIKYNPAKELIKKSKTKSNTSTISCPIDFNVEVDEIILDDGINFDNKKLKLAVEKSYEEILEEWKEKNKNKNGIVDNAKIVIDTLKEAGIDDQYTIVIADSSTLQIDVDSKEDFLVFKKNFKIICKLIVFEEAYYTVSKSGRIHITIKTEQYMSTITKIALQAILGSDRLRELMNYKNYILDHENPILFIEDNFNLENKKKIAIGEKIVNKSTKTI